MSSNATTRAARVALGCCAICLRNPRDAGRATCQGCRNTQRKADIRRRAERKAKSVCVRCGDPSGGYELCARHFDALSKKRRVERHAIKESLRASEPPPHRRPPDRELRGLRAELKLCEQNTDRTTKYPWYLRERIIAWAAGRRVAGESWALIAKRLDNVTAETLRLWSPGGVRSAPLGASVGRRYDAGHVTVAAK